MNDSHEKIGCRGTRYREFTVALGAERANRAITELAEVEACLS